MMDDFEESAGEGNAAMDEVAAEDRKPAPPGAPDPGANQDPSANGMVVGEFEKNSRELVRITFKEYRGQSLVDVRAWYKGKNGDWMPGKGICLQRDKLTTLRRALQAAEKVGK